MHKWHPFDAEMTQLGNQVAQLCVQVVKHHTSGATYIVLLQWVRFILVTYCLSMQGERDRLAFSQQELEKALSEITARTEELEKQHDKEIEKYRLIEVPLWQNYAIHVTFNNCLLPMHLCTCIRSATMY